MNDKLSKKYGLFTAICMVVGTVIGSGVFFKAQDVLNKTNGDVGLGILAWVIGGAVMLFCILAFANMATKYEKVNGIVDYSEALVGPKYGYFIGWFMTTIYYPAMTGTLAWVSARYFIVFVKGAGLGGELLLPIEQGGALLGPETMVIAMFFLVGSFVINAISPKVAGYFQVSTTVIKMIPLLLVAVGGVIFGLVSKDGMLIENFKTVTETVKDDVTGNPLFAAVVSTAFAYEGWIIATSINAELKNAKKNLPIALLAGGAIIAFIYISYYIGVAGGADKKDLMSTGATVAFTNMFGNAMGSLLDVFVVVSCLGTLNGLMLAVSRGMYSLAARGEGPAPHVFKEVDARTNMPTNSAIVGLLIAASWMLYFVMANVSADPTGWLGYFAFDSSELPIVTMYPLYIPIFVMFMVKSKGEGMFKRFIVPVLASAASAFMALAAIYSHGIQPYLAAKAEGKFSCPVLFYLVVFGAIMGIGMLCNVKNKGEEKPISFKSATKKQRKYGKKKK
ncbi:MAG: APC family permease [Clostridia bacterium]|nr:APC family permease [Clostridia bacterium]